MSKIKPKPKKNGSQYCTLHIAPSVRETVQLLRDELKKRNKQWSESRIVNLALIEWVHMIGRLNDTEVDRLFETYEELKTGHGYLK